MDSNIKAEALKLIDKLPDDSTWDDLVHEVFVRQAIEAGLKDSQENRLKSGHQVRKPYGLD